MYQVLYDNPDQTATSIDCRTKAEANRVARKLRKAGKRNVSIWNTRNNSLSALLRF